MSNADYGSHPTRYSQLSDDVFYSNFRDSQWSQLSDEMRQEVLQEAVNRSAVLNGETASCRVSYSDAMPAGTRGQQGNGKIEMNRNHFGQGSDASPRYGPYKGPGFTALETALHEDRHAYQRQVVDGVIEAPEEQRQLFAANQGELVVVEGNVGSTYLNANRSYADHTLYLAQPVEADAHRVSEARVSEIAARQQMLIEQEAAHAPSAQLATDLKGVADYRNELACRSYEQRMTSASASWGVDDLEKEVGTSITNMYEGTSHAVDPVVDYSVHDASIATVQSYGMQQDDQSQTQDVGAHTYDDGNEYSL